jgi:hypothetical protein
MLASGIQVRMARAGLQWSGKELSESSAVGLSTIRKIEAVDGVASVHVTNIQAVTDTLLATGRVRFEGEIGVFVESDRRDE